MIHFLIILLGFISIINCQTTCDIYSGLINKYPSVDKFEYAIDFNRSVMQANYVYYISTSGGNRCKSCKFGNDPYGIDIITSEDYTNTGYDRGHLVPNADYGKDTYIISNAVPMIPKFNSGSWKMSEQFIRDTYAKYLIYKGCDYSYNNFILSNLGNKLYIPIGCYYIVFNNFKLPDTRALMKGDVVDYGYYMNSVISVKEDKFPWWSRCYQENKKSESTYSDFWYSAMEWTLVSLILAIIIIVSIIWIIWVIKNTKNPTNTIFNENV